VLPVRAARPGRVTVHPAQKARSVPAPVARQQVVPAVCLSSPVAVVPVVPVVRLVRAVPVARLVQVVPAAVVQAHLVLRVHLVLAAAVLVAQAVRVLVVHLVRAVLVVSVLKAARPGHRNRKVVWDW